MNLTGHEDSFSFASAFMCVVCVPLLIFTNTAQISFVGKSKTWKILNVYFVQERFIIND